MKLNDLSKIYATGWRASCNSDEAVAKTVEIVLSRDKDENICKQ